MGVKKLVRKPQEFFNQSCTPAKVYLVLSLISILSILIQNLFESHRYCLGMFSCQLDYSNIFIFLLKIVYMVVWAIIINSLCKTNYSNLAWAIVLFPIILMFVMLGLFMVNKM